MLRVEERRIARKEQQKKKANKSLYVKDSNGQLLRISEDDVYSRGSTLINRVNSHMNIEQQVIIEVLSTSRVYRDLCNHIDALREEELLNGVLKVNYEGSIYEIARAEHHMEEPEVLEANLLGGATYRTQVSNGLLKMHILLRRVL
jgi:hypothetical protein